MWIITHIKYKQINLSNCFNKNQDKSPVPEVHLLSFAMINILTNMVNVLNNTISPFKSTYSIVRNGNNLTLHETVNLALKPRSS